MEDTVIKMGVPSVWLARNTNTTKTHYILTNWDVSAWPLLFICNELKW